MSCDPEEKKLKVDCLCLGPTGSGKTLLLKRLSASTSIDFTSSSVPTAGTTIKKIKTATSKEIVIRECGGAIAPLWHHYTPVDKVMFVVDASNLCQISAAGVLLYSTLALPSLQMSKVLIVLSKMDSSYRQMRNEALLMLKMDTLMKEVSQKITIIEASSFSSEGIDGILKWLQEKN